MALHGNSPAAMFLQREPRARLDLLKDPVKHAEHDNSSQKKDKIFKENDAVYARLFNQSEKWMSGVVQEEAGTKSVWVKLSNGVPVPRHVDQLRIRHNEESTTAEKDVQPQP